MQLTQEQAILTRYWVFVEREHPVGGEVEVLYASVRPMIYIIWRHLVVFSLLLSVQ